MPDLPVLQTMTSTIEPITDFTEFKTKESTEGEKSLSFYVHKTDNNESVFDLIQNKEKIEFEGNKYVIDLCDREPIGTTVEKYIEARHEMFDRLKGEFQEEQLTGALRIDRCLNHAFKGTGLTYEVVGSFASEDFENFGRANGNDLFKQIRDRFDVEFRVFGLHVIIAKEIYKVTDAQFRHAHNLKSISEHINTTNLKTFIKGFSYDDDKLVAQATYESPNSHLYKDEQGNKRLIHADYVYDDRFRHNSELREYIKKQLNDTPDYNLKITYEELKKNGFTLHYFELGDYVWCIYEPLDLDLQVRIISIERYPYNPSISPVLELGSYRTDVTKTVAGLKGTAKKVTQQEQKITQAQKTATSASTKAEEAKLVADTSSTSISEHVNDSVRHITEAERSAWNNKAGSGDMQSILQQASGYTNQEIGSLERRSKDYVDSIDDALKDLISEMQQEIDELKERLDNL